jgi:hypothetical protein
MVARTAIVLMIIAVSTLYMEMRPRGIPDGRGESALTREKTCISMLHTSAHFNPSVRLLVRPYQEITKGNMVARTAIVLMIIAVSTLYMEMRPRGIPDGRGAMLHTSAHFNPSVRLLVRPYQEITNLSRLSPRPSGYMSSLESGPPRLETIQARLGQCLYLLSSSRANECWF